METLARRLKLAGKKWTESVAREVLDDWKRTGLSAARYGATIGVEAERLYWWQSRLKREPAKSTEFAPVIPVGPIGQSTGVTVHRGELRIEVNRFDASTAAWVAALLAEGNKP